MAQQPDLFDRLEFDLTDRLRKALRVSDLTVQDMAHTLGVSRNTIGNYLSGRTRPAHATLAAWAFRTGVPFGWLVNGEVPDGPVPTDPVDVFNSVRPQGLEPRTRWFGASSWSADAGAELIPFPGRGVQPTPLDLPA